MRETINKKRLKCGLKSKSLNKKKEVSRKDKESFKMKKFLGILPKVKLPGRN